MAKHTPGPWKVSNSRMNVYSKDNRLCISVQPAKSYRDISIEELEANARLIAQSPKLLSILKWYVAKYGNEEGAEEAIAKAEEGK